MSLAKSDIIALTLVTIAAVFGLSLSLTKPFHSPDEEPIPIFDNPAQEKLFAFIEAEFGLFTAPVLADDWLPDGAGNLTSGRTIYEVQCLHCHGSNGGADTIRSRLLNPPPRNFSLGAIVRTSTPPGRPPRLNDVRLLIRDGVPSTSMSEFRGLPEADRHAAADYVMYLLIRGAVWNQALAQLDTLSPAEAFSQAIAEQKARWSHPEGK